MQVAETIEIPDLSGLSWDAWRDRLEDVPGEDGFAENLGASHSAMLIEQKPILLVSFESFASVNEGPTAGEPSLWPLAKALGWSHLSLTCNGETWFRDRFVIGFFDRLIDDGFFEDFDQVIFYGAGSAGYAACAFSVAAPGAHVLALQPQATLDPRVTEWDDRFTEMRRTDFTERFGYAPDMLDAATQAWVVYDPMEQLDAMHASLFARRNVTLVRTRFMGPNLQSSLIRLTILFRMLAQISAGKLTTVTIARLMRRRREDRGFLSNMMLELERRERYALAKRMCEIVLEGLGGRPFKRGLIRANRALGLTDDGVMVEPTPIAASK